MTALPAFRAAIRAQYLARRDLKILHLARLRHVNGGPLYTWEEIGRRFHITPEWARRIANREAGSRGLHRPKRVKENRS